MARPPLIWYCIILLLTNLYGIAMHSIYRYRYRYIGIYRYSLAHQPLTATETRMTAEKLPLTPLGRQIQRHMLYKYKYKYNTNTITNMLNMSSHNRKLNTIGES